MLLSILGPFEVHLADGRVVEVAGGRLRVLGTLLALEAGDVVASDRLISGLWPEGSPANASNALQSLISRFRRLLPPDCGVALQARANGYRLDAERDRVDAHRFAAAAEEGRRLLGRGDYAAAADALRTGLRLWRGPALADVAELDFVRPAIVWLEELHRSAVEDRVEADLHLGRHQELIAELETLTAAGPLRERPCGQLMRALYAAGRQTDALAVYAHTRELLATELGVDPSPELQDIHIAVLRRDPVLAPTQGGAADDQNSVRTAAELEARPPAPLPPMNNLPAQLTSFVGRRQEVARLASMLGGTRLVTLTGPGGSGKTRLAIEVGQRLLDAYTDGVWFTGLASLREARDVPEAVLTALRIDRPAVYKAGSSMPLPSPDAVDQLVSALSGRKLVLIVDNCEHLVASVAALVDRILRECRSARVIATSREPLGITGETLWPVSRLDLPAADVAVADALDYGSVRLFHDRAAAVVPDFAISSGNLADVVQICRALDGVPLAIELAAARMRSMTPAQIAERLDDRFRLLSSGSRTALPRHRTLRAVVEWSWDLLTEAERVVARRLSVFAGGASPRAADRVCAGTDVPHVDVIDIITGLVDKSLVELDAAAADGEPRYRMLETVRAYGAERLAEVGEQQRVRREHALCVLDEVTAAEPKLRTAEQLPWLARLDAEQGNVQAALRWAIDSGELEIALRLFSGMVWYWFARGHGTEFRLWAGEIVVAVGPRAPPGLAGPYVMAMLGDMPEHPSREALSERLADVERMIDERGAEVTSPLFRGLPVMLAMVRSDHEAALRLARGLQSDEDTWLSAMACFIEGALLVNRGEPDAARGPMETGIARLRTHGERLGLAIALTFAAEVYDLSGEHAAAIAALEESVALGAEIGGRDDGQVRSQLAAVRVRAGDLEAGRAEAEAAVDRAVRTGSKEVEIGGNLAIAQAEKARGDIASARHAVRRARQAAADLGEHRSPGPHPADIMVPSWEGRLAADEGDAERARELLTLALRAAVATEDRPIIAGVVDGFAMAELAAGDARSAAELLGASTMLRGIPNLGDPEARAAADRARDALADDYDVAYAAGRALTAEALYRRLGAGSTERRWWGD